MLSPLRYFLFCVSCIHQNSTVVCYSKGGGRVKKKVLKVDLLCKELVKSKHVEIKGLESWWIVLSYTVHTGCSFIKALSSPEILRLQC